MLTAPLRSRFGMTNRLDYYNEKDLQQIIERSAGLLDAAIQPEGAREIASRSRGPAGPTRWSCRPATAARS